jgi:cytochrome P450
MSPFFLLLPLAISYLIHRALTRTRIVPKGLKELPGPKGRGLFFFAVVCHQLITHFSGYPLIGSLFDMPREKAYMKFKDWADIYGPIFKIDVLGNTHVIISNQTIAEDLMAKRAAIYSDRGALHMVRLVTGGGDLLASSSEGDYWRRGRRFAASMLTPAMAAQWEPFQEQESNKMVQAIMKDPSRYTFWFDRYATSVSLREIYGKTLRDVEEDEFHTNRISERMHNIERVATPGGYLVEIIPAMMYLPEFLAPFRREAKMLHDLESKYFADLVKEARQAYDERVTESPPSFARCWLTKDDNWELSTSEATYVLGTLYGGGSGTTSNAMQSFIQAMCHYPEWQTKLQQEVDEVVGPERLPAFSDRTRLPLVRAVAKEILRWRPVVPGSMLSLMAV